MKTFVFDFDGVIGDTFEAYATFLSKFMKISPQKARLYMREHSLNNGKQSIIKMFVKNFYMQRFEKYLLNQEDLLFEDVLKNIHQLPGSKYIISRNHSRICTDLLADNVHEFTQIYGYDTCRTKVKALQDIVSKDGVSKDDIVFVSDTLGDYKEVVSYLEPHQIWLDTWGFNSRETIEDFNSNIQLLLEPSDILKLGELK